MKNEQNLNNTDNQQLNIACVSGMSLDELHSELSTQDILYCTEKDVNKANQANWKMTLLLNEICKRKGHSDYR